jgi:hypothetical protein
MKIGIIGSGLGNLLLATKFANNMEYDVTIFEKDDKLGGDFAPTELSDGTKFQTTYNTFIDEDDFFHSLKKFDIELPLNAVLNMHQMYAVMYNNNKIIKYNNMFETLETLDLTPTEKKRFSMFYNKWQLNYNTAKAYTTNDIGKQYYHHGIIDRLKDSVFQSFVDESGRLNCQKTENLYQVLPIILDINPASISRQHHYLTIQEHTRGMAYFNRANTNLYDEIIKKISNASNIKVQLATPILNYYQKNIITSEGKEVYDLIIDGTASHVDQKKYKNIGLKTPKVVISLDRSYPNIETNIFYNGSENLAKTLKGKNNTGVSLKIHNPFAVQASIENSNILITPVGIEQVDKLLIEQQIIPILEKVGFHKIKSHIKSIDIVESGKNVYRSQMSKLFTNKLMIESSVNPHLLYNCSTYGYGPQLNQIIQTAIKVSEIIEGRKNDK